MDMPERGDPRAIDLGTLLTVVQAADWAKVSVSTVRRRMEDGELRSEISRERGRDVQRIRWMDLCDLYPQILEVPGDSPEEASKPHTASAPSEAPPASREADSVEVPMEPIAPEVHARETGMQLSIQTLTEQRDDLREQCYDLRVRLSAAEKERQISVGALLQAQKHALASDHAALFVDPGPVWKRPRIWALAASAGLLLWVLSGMFDRLKSDIAHDQERWSEGLVTDTQERLQFQSQRLDSERRAMQDQLVRLNEHNEKQRLAIHDKLEQDQGDRKQLWSQVEALGDNYSQTQQLVQQSLDSEDERRRTWATEQESRIDQHLTQLRSDSMEVLRSELAQERSRSLKQQESISESWRQREQRALQESDRLARTVGDLVARVERTDNKNGDLSAQLQKSEVTNAALRRNLTSDIARGCARWASRFGHWQTRLRPSRP